MDAAIANYPDQQVHAEEWDTGDSAASEELALAPSNAAWAPQDKGYAHALRVS